MHITAKNRFLSQTSAVGTTKQRKTMCEIDQQCPRADNLRMPFMRFNFVSIACIIRFCALLLCINLSIFVLLLGACCINCMLRSINNTTHTRWRTGRQLNLTKSSSNYVYKFTPCHILFFSLNSAASLPVRFTQSATLLSFTCFDTLSLFLSALHWLQSQQKKMCG